MFLMFSVRNPLVQILHIFSMKNDELLVLSYSKKVQKYKPKTATWTSA